MCLYNEVIIYNLYQHQNHLHTIFDWQGKLYQKR